MRLTRLALSASLPLCLSVLALACSSDSGSTTGDDADVTAEIGFPDVPDVSEEEEEPAPFTCEQEDDYDPNHTVAEAVEVGVAGLDASDLYVCPGYDDYFVVDVPAGSGVDATIDFANRLGNLDLYLLPEGETDTAQAVASSTTEDDTEELRYESEAGGRFVLLITGVDGAGGLYDLTIRPTCRNDDDCPCGPTSECETLQHCVLRGRVCEDISEPRCGSDGYEPNNEMSGAFTLAEVAFEGADAGFEIDGLDGAVCGDDVDYYRIVFDEVADLQLLLTFSELDDLDLAVIDEAGEVVAASLGTQVPQEQLDLPSLAPGAYLIYIDTTAGGSSDLDYQLTVRLTRGEACTDNAGCAGAEGRGICQDGGCVPFVPDTPSALGEVCDSSDDCADENAFCWLSEGGLDTNFCTGQCFQDADCSFFENGSCLALFGRFGICFGSCQADGDCPVPFTCVAGDSDSTCERLDCGVDADCGEGQACQRTEFDDAGYCRGYTEVACDGAEVDDDGTTSTATTLDPSGGAMSGTICDADVDWYRVTVTDALAELEVSLSFDASADLDVFVYDAAGRSVGSATSSDANPEVATVPYLAAGDYLVRVDQFPSDAGDRLTSYSLDANVTAMESGCTAEGGECNALVPVRIDCLEGGACGFFDGNGAVEPGGLCDSNDDCTAASDLCYTASGAVSGSNICTHICQDNGACSDVEGTVCTPVGRRTQLCLPE